jgi:hypothetical protein
MDTNPGFMRYILKVLKVRSAFHTRLNRRFAVMMGNGEVCQSLAEFVACEVWGEFVVRVQGGKIKTMEMKRIIKPGDRG